MKIDNDGTLSYIHFDNGLRAVHLAMPRARVGYCGVAVRAGSRDENDSCHGLAHFVEHTIFKGTQRRSSYHIINRMEAVGGELNAFTSKEDTVVYTAFPRGNLSRGLELVADLVRNSRFPADELNKERQVVEDEINSYLDSPADAVFDDFEDLVFAGSPLGHNILGTARSLRHLFSADCRRWLEDFYTPSRMVVFYAGHAGVDRFCRLVEKYFTTMPQSEDALVVSAPPSFDLEPQHVERHVRGAHQANVVIGRVSPLSDAAGRITMALLTNILGGPGMNSLLNVELRERRGLVYSVEAATSCLSDCMLSTIYFACDDEDRELCQKLVAEQIDRIASEGISERALIAARKQYLGQMILAGENTENRIISIARATLMRSRALSDSEVREMVMQVDAQSLSTAACRLLSTSSLALIP